MCLTLQEMSLKYLTNTLHFGLFIINLSDTKLFMGDLRKPLFVLKFFPIILDELFLNVFLERASSEQIYNAVILIGHGW